MNKFIKDVSMVIIILHRARCFVKYLYSNKIIQKKDKSKEQKGRRKEIKRRTTNNT